MPRSCPPEFRRRVLVWWPPAARSPRWRRSLASASRPSTSGAASTSSTPDRCLVFPLTSRPNSLRSANGSWSRRPSSPSTTALELLMRRAGLHGLPGNRTRRPKPATPSVADLVNATSPDTPATSCESHFRASIARRHRTPDAKSVPCPLVPSPRRERLGSGRGSPTARRAPSPRPLLRPPRPRASCCRGVRGRRERRLPARSSFPRQQARGSPSAGPRTWWPGRPAAGMPMVMPTYRVEVTRPVAGPAPRLPHRT